MKKIMTAAAALAFAAVGCVGCSANQEAGAQDQVLTASTQDLLKPGAEMLFLSNCEKVGEASLTTSFGAQTELSPMADTAEMGGFITAPEQIGEGPDEGFHTYTVTCGDQSATFRFDTAANS
ncbi:hypothetical protein [Corynebacterium phocae]|uniref:hypothetical protein n=1 Tax=Corynebacterium phocae TaxID=161895 RepID=UPI000951C66F|nr:hypothetical protein [Corynebacterium phocae]KAA8722193.1 hypothetical protein F4V58_09180 [Corynebacterium phocae]